MSTSMATTPISGERVLGLSFMAGFAYIASPISRLVSLEVVEALCPALRQRSNVTVMRIKAVVDMAVKLSVAVKPRACSNKQSANKPIRPVITVGSTVIRSIVEVSVRTNGSHSDVYANGNLSLRHRCRAQKASNEKCEDKTDLEHDFPFMRSEFPTWTALKSIIPRINNEQTGS